MNNNKDIHIIALKLYKITAFGQNTRLQTESNYYFEFF